VSPGDGGATCQGTAAPLLFPGREGSNRETRAYGFVIGSGGRRLVRARIEPPNADQAPANGAEQKTGVEQKTGAEQKTKGCGS